MRFLKFLELLHKINDPLPAESSASAGDGKKLYKRLNQVAFAVLPRQCSLQGGTHLQIAMSCANDGSARSIDRAALSMYRFVDFYVASLACTNSVNYIFRENSRKMNAEFYKIKKTALLFYAKSMSLRVIFTYYYTPPKPHFSTRVPIFSLSYHKHTAGVKMRMCGSVDVHMCKMRISILIKIRTLPVGQIFARRYFKNLRMCILIKLLMNLRVVRFSLHTHHILY